jgi:hypothetical protein
MRISATAAGVAFIVLAATAFVGAKGPTVKLTITGGGLPAAVEVTTPDALAHVWSDDFIGTRAEAPHIDLPRYQVAFHVLPNRTREVKVMYVVTYVHDPDSGNGFIYLPGRGEEHFWLNASTMLRGGDGRWHRAVPTWAGALNRSLSR